MLSFPDHMPISHHCIFRSTLRFTLYTIE